MSMLSCDSILSEADLRSSALTVLSRTVVHEMPFPQKRSRHGSQRTASGLLELTPAYPVRSSRQKTTPSRIDGWAASYVTRHAASSGWVLKVHDPAPVPATHGPSHPDLHSCRPPCLELGSGARQQLHQRRPWSSPRTARPRRRYDNAFYSSPAPFPTTRMPLPTILLSRSQAELYFRWTPSSTRYRSLRSTGTGTRA